MDEWGDSAEVSSADWAATPRSVRNWILRTRTVSPVGRAAPQPQFSVTPLQRLLDLGQRLSSSLPPEIVLSLIAKTLAEGLRLQYTAIALRHQDTGQLELAAEYRLKPAPDAASTSTSTPTPPAAEASQDAADPADPAEPEYDSYPLVYRRETIGLLVVARRPVEDPLARHEIDLLASIAQQAGAAAYVVRLTNDLQRGRERLVLAREEERRKLRRELHDSIGPTMAALNMKVGRLRTLMMDDPDAAQGLVTELRENIRTVIGDIRRVVYDLRPPALDQLGIVAAIREHARQFDNEALSVKIEAPAQIGALPAAIEVAGYRIVLEALTNVVRHANAKHCVIHLSADDALHIEVQDDGDGFRRDYRAGVGLGSMRERAVELGGSCDILSVPVSDDNELSGTRVIATLPLPVKHDPFIADYLVKNSAVQPGGE